MGNYFPRWAAFSHAGREETALNVRNTRHYLGSGCWYAGCNVIIETEAERDASQRRLDKPWPNHAGRTGEGYLAPCVARRLDKEANWRCRASAS